MLFLLTLRYKTLIINAFYSRVSFLRMGSINTLCVLTAHYCPLLLTSRYKTLIIVITYYFKTMIYMSLPYMQHTLHTAVKQLHFYPLNIPFCHIYMPFYLPICNIYAIYARFFLGRFFKKIFSRVSLPLPSRSSPGGEGVLEATEKRSRAKIEGVVQ